LVHDRSGAPTTQDEARTKNQETKNQGLIRYTELETAPIV
jgi:hypothetical protein